MNAACVGGAGKWRAQNFGIFNKLQWKYALSEGSHKEEHHVIFQRSCNQLSSEGAAELLLLWEHSSSMNASCGVDPASDMLRCAAFWNEWWLKDALLEN